MVTTVGTESAIGPLVKDLIYLEHDAIAAYESAISRLDDPEAKRQVSAFKGDHNDHLQTLHEIARQIGVEAPSGGDMKKMLTTGKVALADLVGGDSTILKAMKTNEDDTVAAYERASRHEDAIPQSKAFFAKALEDELRHRNWFEAYANRLA